MPSLIIVLAIIAGVLHLAHNNFPMEVPTGAAGGPPADGRPLVPVGGGRVDGSYASYVAETPRL
jgi:hypothetical protein